MTVLTPREIGILIYQNGKWGPHSNRTAATQFLDEAIAVAYAESGWNTAAKNASGAAGLYQIMVIVHQEKIPSGASIYDPVVNVDVARKVWNEAGHSWRPWVSSNNAKRQQGRGHGKAVYAYLHSLTPAELKKATDELSTKAQTDITNQERTESGNAAMAEGGDLLNQAAAQRKWWQQILDQLLSWSQQAGVAIGVFILGLVLLILGIWFVVNQVRHRGTRAVKNLVK